uniref:Wsv053 n=1 Tax=White spot syndrome virus TaxID=92652 RepID=A0A2U9GEQ6_WSSV|nr:wsv053 [Shrimp white spot syndrome virus]AWQ62351.1 wsv053 [Shrimp white spot syndrome virus]
MTCPEISKHISGTDRRFWNTADPGGLSYPFNPLFTLHLHLKNFSKIFQLTPV